MTDEKQRTKLEELRIEAGMTVTDLAALAHVSRDVITRCENGVPIRGSTAGKICQVLSVKLGRNIDYHIAEIKIV